LPRSANFLNSSSMGRSFSLRRGRASRARNPDHVPGLLVGRRLAVREAPELQQIKAIVAQRRFEFIGKIEAHDVLFRPFFRFSPVNALHVEEDMAKVPG